MQLIRDIRQQGDEAIDKLKTALRDILPDVSEEYKQGRKGRGLGAWLGGLVGGALNLVTFADLQVLQSHVEETVKNQNLQIEATKRISKEMSSFVQITNDKLELLSRDFAENQQNTLHLVEAITKDYNKQIHFLNNLSLTTLQLLHIMNSMTSYLTELLAACEILITGRNIPSFLISNEDIADTIDHIEQELLQQGNGQHLIFTNPYFYFSSATYIYLRHGKNLIITVQFPLTNLPENYDVYSVQSFAMTLPGQPKNVLRLPGLPAAIGVQRGMSVYFNLTENQAKSVIAEHYATPQTILNDNLYDTCLMAIFKDEQNKIMQLCNFEIQLGQLKPMIFPLEGNKYYLLNITKYSLQCPTGKMELLGCATCVITIATGCSFHYDHIFMPPSYANNSTTEMKHILNVPLLAAFYENETLQYINGETKLEEIQTFDLPEFKFFNHSILKSLANEEKLSVDLRKSVESVKKADVIIRHMPDAIALNHIAVGNKNDFFLTIPGYMVISLIIVSALLLLNVCYLLYRIRMLAILVLLLKQNMVKVQAMSTTPKIPRNLFILTTTTQPPPISTPDIHTQLASWSDKNGMYFLFIILIVCTLIYIIRWISRKTCRHISLDNKTALKMEIMTGSKAATILIQMFNGKPENFLVSPPTQKPTIQISGFFTPTLNINWANAKVISEEDNTTFPFQPLIEVQFLTGLFIRYLLRNAYNLTIFWEFNQTRYNIPIKGTHRNRRTRLQQQLARDPGPIRASAPPTAAATPPLAPSAPPPPTICYV